MDLLLNWALHGTALTGVVALAVKARPGMNAATRERVWWITLVAVTLIPAIYLLGELATAPVAPSDPATGGRAPIRIPAPADRWVMPFVTIAWASWAAVSLGLIGVAVIRLCRVKSLVTSFPGDRAARLQMWSDACGRGRHADLVVSPHVHRAAVLGLRRPAIAVAPDTIAQLTDEELDQVIVHEYAHIQRRDDLAILAQRIISALAGAHPAVWWLNRALTIEREVACDDWVVSYGGAANRYAACLVKLATATSPRRWSVAPDAISSGSQIAIRVARLMARRRNSTIAQSLVTLSVAMPTIVGLVLLAADIPLVAIARGVPADPIEAVAIASFRLVPIPLLGANDSRPKHMSAEGEGLHRVSVFEPGPISRSFVGNPTSAGPSPASYLPVHPAPPSAEAIASQDVLPARTLTLGGPSIDHGPVERISEPASVLESGRNVFEAAGVAIGDGSRYGALKTAGFFSRLGKSVASSF